MKKLLIIILFAIAGLSFTSCSWFDAPANVKRVGCGYIQSDRGLLVVEVDTIKYAPKYVYTNKSTRDGKTTMEPIIGMQVTVFYSHDQKNPKFIAGDRNEEYLEEYFSSNYTLAVIFLIVIIAALVSCFIPAKKNKNC